MGLARSECDTNSPGISDLPTSGMPDADRSSEERQSPVEHMVGMEINAHENASQHHYSSPWSVIAPRSNQTVSMSMPQAPVQQGQRLSQTAYNSALEQDFPISQQVGLDPMNPRPDYMSQEASIGPTAMSSFNWLSPTFDFDFPDLQFVTPEFRAAPENETPTYQSAQHIPDTSPHQWQNLPTTIVHDHETPELSESSYHSGQTVEGTEGSDDRIGNTDGTYYVEGTGARRPRNGKFGKSLIRQPTPSIVQSPQSLPGLGFPEYGMIHEEIMHDDDHILIHHSIYQSMLTAFQGLCIAPSSIFQAYNSSSFPPMNVLNRLVSLCLKCFIPILPFLHVPSLRESECSWLLCLGLAAVGSQYANFCGLETTVPLQEFLRRSILKYVSPTYHMTLSSY